MIIVISKPTFIDDESGLVNELFKEGLELFHIRKPGCEKGDLINLLKGIKEEFYSRIALHQYHEIAVEYNINRLHFPEANRRDADVVKLKEQYILSTSTHSLNDFNYDLNAYDYCFYGPVFNSISKKGYRKMESMEIDEIKKLYRGKIIGIGGIDNDNMQLLKQKAYNGAALLGYIWERPEHALSNFNQIKTKW